MTIDIESMLDRVITDVFKEQFATEDVSPADPTWLHSVEVISRTREHRAVISRAGPAWMAAFVPALDVRAAMVDEDDDVAYKRKS